MSQFYQGVTAGSLPPSVPTSFVTDSGTAIPAGNILNVLGGSTFSDDSDGIKTFGSGNTVSVQLTNRSNTSGTTSDGLGQTLDLITYSFIAPDTCYNFDINIVAKNTGAFTGAGFKIFGTVVANATTATLMGVPDKIENKDPTLAAIQANLVVSGANAIVRVTGLAGTTIDWKMVSIYVSVT